MKLPVVWWCFGFFLLSTMTLAVVQSFSVSILKAMHNVSFEAATMTLTAYMLCGALGMLLGGFVAARMPRHSDRVVAVCMTVAAVCLALCATGLFGATGTMVVLAATGLAVGIGGPSDVGDTLYLALPQIVPGKWNPNHRAPQFYTWTNL
jgi:MFS family permease